MNAVGIDISKGKSMVCIMRPFGEVVVSPFEVLHTTQAFDELAKMIEDLDGETKVIMECTGTYYLPVAYALHEAGLFVSTIHAQIIHNFCNNTIRRAKTDKKDAVKIANYGLSVWLKLPKFVPEGDIRRSLKVFSRQYNKYIKLRVTLKNNFISLTDETFPGVNELFLSYRRKRDGYEKWIDFAREFWHAECICNLLQKRFTPKYKKWCKANNYRFSEEKVEEIYESSAGHFCVMPMDETTKLLVNEVVNQLNYISETIAIFAGEMKRLAEMLPEYPVVSQMGGVGDILAPQVMAEISDVFRFYRKSSLVSFAVLEPVDNKSGKFQGNESVSKQGSPHLRGTLFLVMRSLLQHKTVNDPVYQFIDRKRSEGKHYYCYMTAGSAKFLRIYFARVREYLLNLEETG